MTEQASGRRPRTKRGGTSGTLVVALVGVFFVIGGLAWWSLQQAREETLAREAATAAFLEGLAAAQRKAMDAAIVDLDGDGAGEALTWQELTGQGAPRASADGTARGEPLAAPVLDPGLRSLVGDGIVHEDTTRGFLLRIFLPGTALNGVRETRPDAGFAGIVDTETAERAWVAYAWPRGGAGWNWVVHPDGSVWRSSNEGLRYSAADRTPPWDAGLPAGADPWAPATGDAFTGGDGARWERWRAPR